MFPNEFKKDLRKVQPEEEEENDFPPYRPPPPPEKEDVPEKVLTLQERMNKFQQKVTSNAPPPKVGCFVISSKSGSKFVTQIYSCLYQFVL